MRTTVLTLVGSAIYATLRYNGFKGVPWEDWPTYTMNKVFAVSAVVLLLVAALRRVRGSGSAGPLLGHAAIVTALHVVLSLMLLTPAYFAKYFAAGKLTGTAGVAMTFGALALAWMMRGALTGRPARGGLAVLAGLTVVHTAVQGFEGWLDPTTWPGGLPPITLLSTVLAGAALAIAARGRARR